MTIRATQPIASAFGTYLPGDEIDEAADPVIEAWLAAGIVAKDSEEVAVETPKPVERAVTPKREKAVGRRQSEEPSRRLQTEATPHRRFQPDVKDLRPG